jgi:hypothetical protein
LRSVGLLWRRFLLLRGTFTFQTDSFKQHTRRFIGWVLRYEFTLESTFENRLAKSISAFEVRGDDSFEFINDGETTLNLSNDAVLFRNRREESAIS